MIQSEDIYLKVSLLTSVSHRLSPQIKHSHVLILAHHTTADSNPLACEPKSQDVHSVSLSEGGTHPGPSVVACLLEKSYCCLIYI